MYTDTGQAYLDAASSWWTNLHGHSHPYIVEAITDQANLLDHVLFAGYTHPQAIILAERLIDILPKGLSKVFFSDNGSTAVETAIKMAFQAVGQGKSLLSFNNAYHGDTFGAMSASGKTHYNQHFWPYLFQVHSIPPPTEGNEEASWKAFQDALNSHKVGAFIFEPLIQGPGGMIIHSADYLDRMLAACHDANIITIADEVMTGFGRTGPLFACNYLKTVPDVICLAKALTGGTLPLAATVVKEFLFEKFLSQDLSKALLHGHTYTANPIACAAANANLDLLLDDGCSLAREMINKEHLSFKQKWQKHPKLVRCEVLGTLLAIEYPSEGHTYYYPHKQKLIDLFHAQGILLRPFGRVLHVLPPYCITRSELKKIYSTLEITLEQWP